MALPHGKSPARWNGWIAAALVLSLVMASSQVDAQAEFHIAPDHVDNLKELFARIGSC